VDLVRNQQWSILSLSGIGSEDSARLCRSAQTNKRSVDTDISRSSFPLGRRTSVCSSNCSEVYFLVSVRFSFSCEILFRRENSVDLFEQCVRPGCVCVCVYVVLVEIENGDTLITELAKNTSVAEVRDK
jgi:hypothetical protein